MKKVMKDIFMTMVFNTLKNYMNFIMIYRFYLKEGDSEKYKNLELIYIIKLNMLYTKEI